VAVTEAVKFNPADSPFWDAAALSANVAVPPADVNVLRLAKAWGEEPE